MYVERVPRWPESDLLNHWQQPALILSQTCGYPLVTQLPEVQVVGCFHYTAAGCEGSHYRSFLVTRSEDRPLTLADFRGRRAVCNSPDSQSGYHALRKSGTVGDPRPFLFANVIQRQPPSVAD